MKSAVVILTLALTLMIGFIALTRREPPQPHSESVTVPSALPVSEAVARHVTLPEPSTLPSATATNAAPATNLWLRLAQMDIPKLTREQVEVFLAKNNRSVEALLGALRACGDPDLWQELKEKFPNDPRVQFAAAFKNDTPAERTQWLEKLKQSDPDNALANYLLGNQHLNAGNTEQALAELTAANGKHSMNNYLLDFIQNAEEAYRAAGYSDAEAKAIACDSALLPELAFMRETGLNLVELAKRYQAAGDPASADAVLQMGLNLGHRLDQTPQISMIQDLVGILIERKTLEAMDPNAPYGNNGQTVKDQIAALVEQRKSYRELNAKADPILQTMSAEEIAHFYDRIKLYGSVAAMKWVINRGPAAN